MSAKNNVSDLLQTLWSPALLVLVVVAVAGLWSWRRQVRWQRAHVDLEQRLTQAERRARQLDEAEQIVSLGSFDWLPGSDELHWSEQHYRLWGCEPGTVTPSLALFERHLHPEDAERVMLELRRALDGRSSYDCRHRVLRADGSVRHVHGRGKVLFDAQGRAVRMTGAVLDITERVQAEEDLRLYGFVLDAIADPVSVADSDLRYRLANAAWLRVNARRRDEVEGRTMDELFPRVVSPLRRQALLDCNADRQPRVVQAPSPSIATPDQILETRYFPFDDPHVPWRGTVMVSRDITALENSADNLRLTLNTIGDAIFATDARGPDDPVLFANDELLRLWHIPPERANPLTARTIMVFATRLFRHPESESARVQAIVDGNLSADDRLELTDGRVLQRRCRPRLHHPRTVRVWTFRDVTAEVNALRALAQAEERQRMLLEAFPGFIWVIDEHWRVVYLNRAAAGLYTDVPTAVGRHVEEVVGAEVLERVRGPAQRALDGEVLTLEWQRMLDRFPLPDHLLVRLVPGRASDGTRLLHAFGIDITSLKQAQTDLATARDEAERANRAKTQFLSTMSHELRTPLNAVIGFSQVLEQNADRNLTPRQVRQLGEIRRAGGHLLDLINDLLDLARIEAGRTVLDLEPVPLAPLVEECLQLVQPLAARQGRHLLQPVPAAGRVRANRVRLKQVLLNLLSNAIKYNRDGGQVRLSWHVDDADVVIEVEDDGPGIDAADQARLFRPFERLQAERGDAVGTGIGLALSRHLVQLMGGRIGVRSAPGQGSCFWVRLAIAPEPPRHRLLYIDDNPINLALLQGLFEDHPQHRLLVAERPVAALTLLRQQPFDALLLDLQMPDLDGFALFHELRADPATQALPVVAVTADATPATRQRCLDLGFVDVITKPVDAERLLAAVDRALQRPTPPPG